MDFSKGLLIATANKGKIREISQLLNPIKTVSPLDIGLSGFDVEEHGETFRDNALIKAMAYAKKTGFISLADDSGLEVDALNGAPGLKSARYAGLGAGDKDLVAKLLEEMKDVPADKRSARFVCVVCIYNAVTAESIFAEGECRGLIAFEPKGTGGFGYDPVFIPDGYNLSMAQIEPQVKNSISHRARAILALMKKL